MNTQAASAFGCALVLYLVAATVEPASAPDRLFDICASKTVAEAVQKGGRLGWRRLTDADLEPWRSSFESGNARSVEVVGWRRDAASEKSDALSFWIAAAPRGHRACAYSAAEASGLIEALSERFGGPENLDRSEVATTAFWKAEPRIEVTYSEVGSAVVVYIVSFE